MKRRGGKKSYTGCTTCKTRRVKCDETRPSCLRCTSTGRKCEGPATGPMIRINPLSNRLWDEPVRTISVFGQRGPDQVRAYEFFVHNIVPNVTRVISREFWDFHLLQAALSDPAVWHAVSAMSEIVKYYGSESARIADRSGRMVTLRPALRWYMKSTCKLQMSISAKPFWSATCGITAVIYFCIECLLDNLEGALSIYLGAVGAMKIAQEFSGEQKPVCDPMVQSVTVMFDHLAVAHGLKVADHLTRATIVSNPTTFEHARAILEHNLAGDAHEFANLMERTRICESWHWKPGPELRAQGEKILARLYWWSSKVAANDQIEPGSPNQLKWAVTHLVHLNYVIWVSALLDVHETAFDRYHDMFGNMLDHAQTAIEAHGKERPIFSFDTRVIPSLTFVATRCRHPLLRRRALELLQIGPKIENTRKAELEVTGAKRMIGIEEGGRAYSTFYEVPLHLQLPEITARIAWAKVDRSVDKNGKTQSLLRFGRWRYDAVQQWHLIHETVQF